MTTTISNSSNNNNLGLFSLTKIMSQSLDEDNSVKEFYKTKIQELEIKIKEKQLNFMRLQAQRNELNEAVLRLRDEVKHLIKSSSIVAEVIKVLGKETVLVKTTSEGKLIVNIDKSIKIEDLNVNTRVTLKSEEKLKINRILPSRVDPLVSLMRVEKVPDSNYDSVGGLEEQIKEVREVIELPIKHPEIFESLGIAQPKGVIMVNNLFLFLSIENK